MLDSQAFRDYTIEVRVWMKCLVYCLLSATAINQDLFPCYVEPRQEQDMPISLDQAAYSVPCMYLFRIVPIL